MGKSAVAKAKTHDQRKHWPVWDVPSVAQATCTAFLSVCLSACLLVKILKVLQRGYLYGIYRLILSASNQHYHIGMFLKPIQVKVVPFTVIFSYFILLICCGSNGSCAMGSKREQIRYLYNNMTLLSTSLTTPFSCHFCKMWLPLWKHLLTIATVSRVATPLLGQLKEAGYRAGCQEWWKASFLLSSDIPAQYFLNATWSSTITGLDWWTDIKNHFYVL